MKPPTPSEFKRPYLVIPKLVEQPTWGGHYIAKTKGWHKREPLDRMLIGQSYELYSGSNFSLLESSDDPAFKGEVTDRDAVEGQTHPDNSTPLTSLLAESAEDTLGAPILQARGPHLQLLIKYTQALGNSFQVHMKDTVHSEKWKPKPESWYYFEPGLITLGAQPGVDWDAYRGAVTAIEAGAIELGHKVATHELAYEDAKSKLDDLVQQHDPWQFVNTVEVESGQLVDLSGGGLQHSWEEDPKRAPLGNVLYEIQFEALDKISTFRSFDKGKLGTDGSVRSLQIDEYFQYIDRSPAANDPKRYIRAPNQRSADNAHRLDGLLESKYYNLDRLILLHNGAHYSQDTKRFKHLFVKSGRIKVTAPEGEVTVTEAHSCFVPAGAATYSVTNLQDHSEVLISY